MRIYTDNKLIELSNIISAHAQTSVSMILEDIKESADIGRYCFNAYRIDKYYSAFLPGEINQKIIKKALSILMENGYSVSTTYQIYLTGSTNPDVISTFNISW